MSTTVLDPRSHTPGKENRIVQGRDCKYPRSSRVTKREPARTALPNQGRQPTEATAAFCHLEQELPRPARDCPRQATASPRPPLYREALAFDDLRHDKERIRTYCWWRHAGSSPEEARALSHYGMHYAHCTAERRAQLRDLLDAHGVSRSPLCWPRMEIELDRPLLQCQVLGSGSFNEVLAIRVGDQDYAFRPSRPVDVAQTSSKDDQDPFSENGGLLGLRRESFFPELRYIVAVRIADSLGLAGPQGLVPGATVAIVNGVPGLLLERVHGKSEGRGNMWQHKLPLVSRDAAAVLKAMRRPGGTEKVEEAARHAGLYAIHVDSRGPKGFGPDAGLYLTGTLGKRDAKAQARYSSWAYQLAMAKVQVFSKLVGLPDIHAGNIMAERQPDGGQLPRLIDLDEALPPLDPEQVQLNKRKSWIRAAMCLPVIAIPAETRRALHSARCKEMNEVLRQELRLWLPAAELDSFARREKSLRQAHVPDFVPEAAWQPGLALQPELWLLDRVIGFSTHAFGESEDSSSVSEAEDAGVATRVLPDDETGEKQ